MNNILNQSVELFEVSKLKQHPKNANIGDLHAITESIETNGFFGTVIVNKRDNTILAGNHRFMAAKSLGYEKIPVCFIDVSEAEALRILVADNRTTRLGYDDDQALVNILSELALTPVGLQGTGFCKDDIDVLLGKLNTEFTQSISKDGSEIEGMGADERGIFFCPRDHFEEAKEMISDVLDQFGGRIG